MRRETADRKSVSPNESEPVSASLHQMDVAKLPNKLKPEICREETSTSTCRTFRGERGERALKDTPRNLGDPPRPGIEAGG